MGRRKGKMEEEIKVEQGIKLERDKEGRRESRIDEKRERERVNEGEEGLKRG